MSKAATNPTGLIGRAKEFRVAARLIESGLYVYFPLVDHGIDLVVTDAEWQSFVPLQIRYRQSSPGLGLTKKEADRFQRRNMFLIYLLGEGQNERIWFIPYDVWRSHAKDKNRRDRRLYVTVSEAESEGWLRDYADEAGIRAMKKALKKNRLTYAFGGIQ